ncbi:hypothetical protein GCM10012275_33080 [Longimycelium tulufanense]|uniref:Secreted protein n=1 Tax=Longimycelium tulufanense TaxID=907463 RepID=A0A8J3FVM7_9PSEU|nr:hypothetical protein [Longimycelium tulufanense]GGM59293.1 hypothetical protein GCM10012275_33080 [Longimycelium tulufanense]
MRRLIRLPLLLTTALGLFVGLSVPTQAAELARVRGDVCRGGVCGSATFNFTGIYQLTNVSLSVKDSKCDSHDVYIQLLVYKNTGKVYTTKRRNSKGCRGGYKAWHGRSFSTNDYIKGVRVRGCVDDPGRDTCYHSRYLDNPNT